MNMKMNNNNISANRNGFRSNGNSAEYGEKNSLFDVINAISFALDELRLFLDTHPADNEALNMYGELIDRRHALVSEFTEKFRPVNSYFVNTENGWSWTDAPLPWKAEAN